MSNWEKSSTGKPDITDIGRTSIDLIASRIDNCEDGLSGDDQLPNIKIGANGGASTIDYTPVGQSNPDYGAFTEVDIDDINIDGNTISSSDDIEIEPGAGKKVTTTKTFSGAYLQGGGTGTSYPEFLVEKRTVTWTGSISHTGTNSGIVYTVPDKEQILEISLTSWDLTATGNTSSINTLVWLTVDLDDSTNQYNNGDTGNDSSVVTYAVGDYTSAKNIYFNITGTGVIGTRAVTEVVFDLYLLKLNI